MPRGIDDEAGALRIDGPRLGPAARTLALEEILEHVAERHVGRQVRNLQLAPPPATFCVVAIDDDCRRQFFGEIGDGRKLLKLLRLRRDHRCRSVIGRECQRRRHGGGQNPFHRSSHNPLLRHLSLGHRPGQ